MSGDEELPHVMVRYLCPAPWLTDATRQCLLPLPCTEHGVENWWDGHVLYGNVYAERVTAPRSPGVASPGTDASRGAGKRPGGRT